MKNRFEAVDGRQLALAPRLQPSQRNQFIEPDDPPAGRGRLRLLVAERNPENRAMLVFYLAHLGHWVESVSGPGMALKRLRQDGFDVFLTGIWKPDASGWSLLSELKNRGELPPRVITMSSMNMHEGRTLSQAAGCYAHLAKPFLLSELDTALK